MTSFVTIKTFGFPGDAHLYKLSLEQEGIETFLKDELSIQSDQLLSPALGGVKLQVQEADVERALAILKQLDSELGVEPSAITPLGERLPLIIGLSVCLLIILFFLLNQ